MVQALKALIIIMGVVLVLGFGFLGYEVYKRATDPNHPRGFGRKPPATAETPEPASAAGTDVLAGVGPVALPPGSTIAQMAVLTSRRLVYHVVLPDGSHQIHLLDTSTGRSQLVVDAPASGASPTMTPPSPATP